MTDLGSLTLGDLGPTNKCLFRACAGLSAGACGVKSRSAGLVFCCIFFYIHLYEAFITKENSLKSQNMSLIMMQRPNSTIIKQTIFWSFEV